MTWSVIWLGAIQASYNSWIWTARCAWLTILLSPEMAYNLKPYREGDASMKPSRQFDQWRDESMTPSEEIEEELRNDWPLALSSLTGRGRVRSKKPEPIANRLGPLATESSGAAPAAPNSDLRKRLRTAPPPQRQPLESRLERRSDQNQTNSQTYTSASNLPTTTPAPVGNISASAAPAEGIELTSVLQWNRPAPSACGLYKADMLASLNMNTLICRSDARRMMNGDSPMVLGLYRKPGVDWLLA